MFLKGQFFRESEWDEYSRSVSLSLDQLKKCFIFCGNIFLLQNWIIISFSWKFVGYSDVLQFSLENKILSCVGVCGLWQITRRANISIHKSRENSSLWFCPCPCPVICPLFLPCNFCPVNFALCFALLVFVLLFLPLPLGWYFHFHYGCCVGGHFLITMIFIFSDVGSAFKNWWWLRRWLA